MEIFGKCLENQGKLWERVVNGMVLGNGIIESWRWILDVAFPLLNSCWGTFVRLGQSSPMEALPEAFSTRSAAAAEGHRANTRPTLTEIERLFQWKQRINENKKH